MDVISSGHVWKNMCTHDLPGGVSEEALEIDCTKETNHVEVVMCHVILTPDVIETGIYFTRAENIEEAEERLLHNETRGLIYNSTSFSVLGKQIKLYFRAVGEGVENGLTYFFDVKNETGEF